MGTEYAKEMSTKIQAEIDELTAKVKGLRPIANRLQASLQKQAAAKAEVEQAKANLAAAKEAVVKAEEELKQAEEKQTEVEEQIQKDAKEATEKGLWKKEELGTGQSQATVAEQALQLLKELEPTLQDPEFKQKVEALLKPPDPTPMELLQRQQEEERKRAAEKQAEDERQRNVRPRTGGGS